MRLHPGQPAVCELLDNTFRNAPLVFYIAEVAEPCAIAYVSPNIERMLGYSTEEFLVAPSFWKEHLHPEDAGKVAGKLRRCPEPGHHILEYRFLDAHGTYRWLQEEVDMIHPEDGSPACLQGYLLDISAQKYREAILLETQRVLQEKNLGLQQVLDSLPQRLLWKDRNSVFKGCNQVAARALGLERTDDIVGKTDFAVHADRSEAEYLRLADEAVMATGHATYHAYIQARQEGIWLDVTKVPLRQDGEAVSGLLVCYEYVSERKRNEFELRKFRRVVEQSSSAVAITNVKGELVYVNPRFLQLYGYVESEVLGKNPRLLHSGTVSAKTYRELWKTILNGRVWHGELLNKAKNGELFCQATSISPIFDENGEVIYFLAIEDDITQRKLLEARLQRQLAFTQTLSNALPHPVYFMKPNGIYWGCNRAFEEIMGLGEGEVVGKTVFDIAPRNLALKYHEMDNELFSQRGVQSYETRLRHHDGSLHDVLFHKATFNNEKGEIGGIIGSIFDISDIKHIQDELRQSEQRFRTIANYTYNWENWIDSSGKLLWVNPAVERVCGYTPEECYAMPDYPVTLIHSEDRPLVARHFAETLAGAAHRDLECRILHKDGGFRWVKVAVQQVYDAAGNNIGHRSSLMDVTDRRQAMDDLHDTRALLQLVLDHIPQGVFWKGIDGTYLGGNAVFARDIGLGSGEEARGLTDFDIFPAEEAGKFISLDQKVLRTDKVMSNIEEQFTDSQGSKHSVLVCKIPMHNHQGKLFSLLGTYTDLTEIKHLDAELRESEARLREITTTAAEGIYVVDSQGLLKFVNPEAQRLLSVDASRLLGKPLHLLCAESCQCSLTSVAVDKHPCRIMENTRMGKQYCSDEEVFLRSDGTAFNISLRANPIMRNGEYSGAVVAFHDISEQKLTQQHLQETLLELQSVNASLEQRVQEQTQQNIEKERLLIQQSRSAAMGEMISNIAHQWRQPLSTLGLVVQNILLDYREKQLQQEDLEQYVNTAQQCVTRMSETIDDFRDFFRPDKTSALFNLHQAIGDSLQLLEATLKNNNIKVSLSEDQGLQAFGHVNEFSQVILNLLANAKDALVANKVRRGRIDIELRSNDRNAMIVIRDNAGGIPEEAMAKIFDPYFTTKVGGTGIGLYMSKTIIEKHMGGGISCCNTADGAEFEVSIALDAGDETKVER